MEIKTKLNVGDEAWLMENNAAVVKDVTAIDISIDADGHFESVRIRIVYSLGKGTNPLRKPELVVFASKAELLASL